MNEIITTSVNATIAAAPTALPVPAAPITVRLATNDDLAFIDALQKQHSKQLGFFPRAQMQGYVDNGWMVIAEDAATGERLGYCASRDRYLKRDELGIIYQLCVVPGSRRRLIGATLLKAVFERSAYGTRLYCCWCAQDLKANYFWESMGFVPLAVRAGGKGKLRSAECGLRNEEDAAAANPQSEIRNPKSPRVHIFWQARIRAGDTTTPWWYPCGTDGGAMRAGRIVVPIPPGVNWREATVPTIEMNGTNEEADATPTKRKRAKKAEPAAKVAPVPESQRVLMRGLRFANTAPVAEPMPAVAMAPAPEPAPAPKPKRTQAKVDPAIIARTRELRDRWMEHVNASPMIGQARYDVTRGIEGGMAPQGQVMLPAA